MEADERLVDAAQRAIKQYILDQQLRPGDPLPTEEHRHIPEALEQGAGPGARAATLASFGTLRDRLREAQQAAQPESRPAAGGRGADEAARDVQS
jgi:DNA-binding FadR family transcriptional regulator